VALSVERNNSCCPLIYKPSAACIKINLLWGYHGNTKQINAFLMMELNKGDT
jgi:hypothetical protein